VNRAETPLPSARICSRSDVPTGAPFPEETP
jgi:hypothetical protein